MSKEDRERFKNLDSFSVYIQNEPTGGNTYDTGCMMCQGKGSGLINAFPLPTHRTLSKDGVDGSLIFNYICKGCTANAPKNFIWVWVDKLPIFPDDIAITEIPAELNEEGKNLWCEERGINPEDYE